MDDEAESEAMAEAVLQEAQLKAAEQFEALQQSDNQVENVPDRSSPQPHDASTGPTAGGKNKVRKLHSRVSFEFPSAQPEEDSTAADNPKQQELKKAKKKRRHKSKVDYESQESQESYKAEEVEPTAGSPDGTPDATESESTPAEPVQILKTDAPIFEASSATTAEVEKAAEIPDLNEAVPTNDSDVDTETIGTSDDSVSRKQRQSTTNEENTDDQEVNEPTEAAILPIICEPEETGEAFDRDEEVTDSKEKTEGASSIYNKEATDGKWNDETEDDEECKQKSDDETTTGDIAAQSDDVRAEYSEFNSDSGDVEEKKARNDDGDNTCEQNRETGDKDADKKPVRDKEDVEDKTNSDAEHADNDDAKTDKEHIDEGDTSNDEEKVDEDKTKYDEDFVNEDKTVSDAEDTEKDYEESGSSQPEPNKADGANKQASQIESASGQVDDAAEAGAADGSPTQRVESEPNMNESASQAAQASRNRSMKYEDLKRRLENLAATEEATAGEAEATEETPDWLNLTENRQRRGLGATGASVNGQTAAAQKQQQQNKEQVQRSTKYKQEGQLSRSSDEEAAASPSRELQLQRLQSEEEAKAAMLQIEAESAADLLEAGAEGDGETGRRGLFCCFKACFTRNAVCPTDNESV